MKRKTTRFVVPWIFISTLLVANTVYTGPSGPEVELSISGRNLLDRDLFSKSDPMCVIYIQPFGASHWVEIKRTEKIQDTHDPDFVSKVVLPYKFEEQQPLMFEIYDVDDPKSQDLRKQDFLGFVTCNLAQIVTRGREKFELQKRNALGQVQTTQSYLIISAEELMNNNDEIILQLAGTHLDNLDFFGRSDPFIEIYKPTENNDFVLVHKTEVIKNNLNPRWKRFSIPVKNLCNGDFDRSLKFVCKDHDTNGMHSRIGEFQATLREITENRREFSLVNPDKKKKKRNYKDSGKIHVEYFEIVKNYSFLDYIRGGLQIHCTVAIDFTASNNDPSPPNHYIDMQTGTLNNYEQAITSVVSIIEEYDTDKQFPVLGFGARLQSGGPVFHDFNVSLDPRNAFCTGVEGVLQAYRNCILHIQLYGPTQFAPVIRNVIRMAESYSHENGAHYFILLILTDGEIMDMPQTVKAIVHASRLPISIIIVGIGNENFKAMDALDADQVPLEAGGERAQRDIVQFVPFNKYLLFQGDPRTARLRMAQEVLAEVPRQVASYMKLRNFIPRPPNFAVIDGSVPGSITSGPGQQPYHYSGDLGPRPHRHGHGGELPHHPPPGLGGYPNQPAPGSMDAGFSGNVVSSGSGQQPYHYSGDLGPRTHRHGHGGKLSHHPPPVPGGYPNQPAPSPNFYAANIPPSVPNYGAPYPPPNLGTYANDAYGVPNLPSNSYGPGSGYFRTN